jgi:lipoprotein-anchoring transpeptidase ErfK/SrfK
MLRSKLNRAILVVLLGVLALAAAPAAPAGAESEAAASGKRIVVILSQQKLYAYQGSKVVFTAAVNARGTRRGTFRVQNRIAKAGSIYRGWRLPYWLGIYYVGRVQNGIHGPAVTGRGSVTTASLGCIVLRRSADAARLFSWTPVGTPVTVK